MCGSKYELKQLPRYYNYNADKFVVQVHMP